MQTADLIRLMFEELQEESRQYQRLREEYEKIKSDKELAQRRVALLREACSELEHPVSA